MSVFVDPEPWVIICGVLLLIAGAIAVWALWQAGPWR